MKNTYGKICDYSLKLVQSCSIQSFGPNKGIEIQKSAMTNTNS